MNIHSLMLFRPAKPLEINRSEVLRYIGYGANRPDQLILSLVEDCDDRLAAAIEPKCVYITLPIKVKDDCVIPNGCELRLSGFDIAAHLKGCDTAVFMAATLSEQADRLIRQSAALDMTAGLIMDGCATAAVEQLCDDFEAMLRRQYPNSFLRPRFSPGYGDLPVEIQREFLELLDAPRKIGLCATDSCMLTPRKSVTVVIGIGNESNAACKTGCDACQKRESCVFKS